MLELNQKIYPKETIVGWFSDLPELNYDAALIHQFFASKESNFVGKANIFTSPLIVLVDPFASETIFGMKVLFPKSFSAQINSCRDILINLLLSVKITLVFSNKLT